ncbi:radical SAM family heme chaperone HemW [Serinibacter salmoneus]|uniref:Heme chaperone HemW n=1 Tax=Serinibacter salmoneus TaxID=556530 RepID=A0A2A9D014_9MICO|nr:radical SAM family heme chaperone HemW [Serinibacter salmoneus]PFG20027.1 anaerobic coproporphyrinogen III oxidase [Serinibacter salmoneus]
MSPALPDGEAAPRDGSLPPEVLGGAQERAFGVYLHVPFCAARCGYCDFNTYTATELGGGASAATYAEDALREIALARDVMHRAGLPAREVGTVFVGGGTPTMLPADDLVRMLAAVREAWGIAEAAEVTTEANPDSVSPASLARLREGGFTRVSFGVQSVVPEVLATLDRTHDPRRVPEVVAWAKEAGLAVSVDLIYGTPGESLAQWRASLEGALALEPDHISAYALTVEPGTALHRRVRRGELPAPTGDDEAAKYELADDLLAAGGYSWYEISNWARTPDDRCRHNLAYWRGEDWWGIGPGAHSHIGGVRWWNVKHPRAYAGRLARGESPAAGRELLDATARELERVLLGTRLAEGFPVAGLDAGSVAQLERDGLVTCHDARLHLTRRGRLLADAVVHALT